MTGKLIDAEKLKKHYAWWDDDERRTLFDQIVDAQPTIDAEPVRHGKWITEECLPGVAVCSICGHEIRGIGCQYTKYCDDCGAKMLNASALTKESEQC